MSSKTPKVKFFPPIKTAASFLRTISKSPELSSHNSPNTRIKDYIPDLQASKQFSSFTKDPGTFTERSTASKRYRELQEALKSPELESKNLNLYLPTTIDQLRALVKSKTRCGGRETRGREGVDLEIRIPFEDSRKFMIEGQNLENSRLKEWLSYMKSQYLSEFFTVRLKEKESFNGLEAFKLVLRVASQECVKQISVQCLERGEMVNDLLSYTKLYCKVKKMIKVRRAKAAVKELERKVQGLIEEINKATALAKEKEEMHSHETGLLKSALILKEVDIESLSEHVKKLKADRTYRIKKDLEKYNELLSNFDEYRQLISGLVTEPHTQRNLARKRDSIRELVLTKLNLTQDKKLSSRLTEEQRIEHEMLSTNLDHIFFDKSIQVLLKPETDEKKSQASVQVADQEVLTDEILELVQEEIIQDIDEIFVQPNIMITNENLEEVAFSNFANNLNEISIIEESNEEEEVVKTRPTRMRVSSVYKWRENETKYTQTEEKIFLEVARQEEEELLEWMLHDRKNYLKSVQKQIYHKKNELSRVNILVSKSRSMLGDSPSGEDSRFNSFISSEDSEDVLEKEIQYLKSVGLLDKEVEIESWKTGYYYGYDKGKTDTFVNEEIEKAKAQETLSDVKPEEPELLRSKTKRNSLIGDNIRNQRRGTKVVEFNFQHKEGKAAGKLAANSLRHNFIEEFLQESSKAILKQAKMSRKMLIKTISSLYSAGIIKKSTSDIHDLASFTYDEFSSRFGQQIVTKKLVEFLASVLKYPDSRKTINFAKLIGIGKKIGLEDYVRPKESFDFLLDFSAALQKSNLGITFNIDEGLDYQFVPAIRAVECSKEMLSKYFDSTKISAVISKIEANSHPDPKKINKFGIIDQEFLTEMLLLEIDGMYSGHLKAIWTVFEAFYSTKYIQRVFKYDFVLMVRYLSHDKFQIFAEELNSVQGYDERSKTLPVNKIVDLCLVKNLMTQKDLETFLGEFDEEVLKESVNRDKDKVKRALLRLFEDKEVLELTQQYAIEWENRFDRITERTDVDLKVVFIVWGMLNMEIERLGGMKE